MNTQCCDSFSHQLRMTSSEACLSSSAFTANRSCIRKVARKSRYEAYEERRSRRCEEKEMSNWMDPPPAFQSCVLLLHPSQAERRENLLWRSVSCIFQKRFSSLFARVNHTRGRRYAFRARVKKHQSAAYARVQDLLLVGLNLNLGFFRCGSSPRESALREES